MGKLGLEIAQLAQPKYLESVRLSGANFRRVERKKGEKEEEMNQKMV